MMRQPLNIWRVYMDLFANFMGLVVLGGAGLMVMIGGAVPHASPGGAAFPNSCIDGGTAEALEFYRDDKVRNAIVNPESCTIKNEYSTLQFSRAQFTLNWKKEVEARALSAICKDLATMVRFVRQKPAEARPLIEVVGHASSEYSNTKFCGSELGASLRKTKNKIPRQYWSALEAYERERQTSPPFNPDHLDRHICNAAIASARSVDILNQCVTLFRSSEEAAFIDDAVDMITMTAEPQNSLSGDDEICRSKAQGDALDSCRRTVSLRLHLLPKAGLRTEQKARSL